MRSNGGVSFDRGGRRPSRREAFKETSLVGISAALLSVYWPSPAHADVETAGQGVGEGLGPLRKFTALAPLGDGKTQIGTAKRVCPQAENAEACLSELADLLENDVVKGATGKGGYFISGDIRPEIFRDDCRFVDPTNDVASLSRYQKALTILFDPQKSFIEFVSPPRSDAGSRTIRARIRAGGELKLPWKPLIQPWESEVVWQVGEDGLIAEQRQQWNITAADALRQTFSFF